MNEAFEILNIVSFSFALLVIRHFIIFHSGRLFGEEIMIYYRKSIQENTDIIFIFSCNRYIFIYLSIYQIHVMRVEDITFQNA